MLHPGSQGSAAESGEPEAWAKITQHSGALQAAGHAYKLCSGQEKDYEKWSMTQCKPWFVRFGSNNTKGVTERAPMHNRNPRAWVCDRSSGMALSITACLSLC